jgi:hypothetical protein
MTAFFPWEKITAQTKESEKVLIIALIRQQLITDGRPQSRIGDGQWYVLFKLAIRYQKSVVNDDMFVQWQANSKSLLRLI